MGGWVRSTEGCNIEGCNIEGCNIEGCNIEGCNIEGSRPEAGVKKSGRVCRVQKQQNPVSAGAEGVLFITLKLIFSERNLVIRIEYRLLIAVSLAVLLLGRFGGRPCSAAPFTFT